VDCERKDLLVVCSKKIIFGKRGSVLKEDMTRDWLDVWSALEAVMRTAGHQGLTSVNFSPAGVCVSSVVEYDPKSKSRKLVKSLHGHKALSVWSLMDALESKVRILLARACQVAPAFETRAPFVTFVFSDVTSMDGMTLTIGTVPVWHNPLYPGACAMEFLEFLNVFKDVGTSGDVVVWNAFAPDKKWIVPAVDAADALALVVAARHRTLENALQAKVSIADYFVQEREKNSEVFQEMVGRFDKAR
jgi:hypothetical protein